MWHNVWMRVIATPGWVYTLLIFLLILGIQATRPIIIPIKRLFIMPIIFLILSSSVIMYAIKFNSLNIASWVAGALLGIVLGQYQLRALKPKCIEHRDEIYIPGTFSLLVITSLLVALKFIVNLEIKIDPKWIYNLNYQPYFMTIYGFIAGMFLGRLIQAYAIVNYGPFIGLNDARPVLKKKK